MAKIIRPGKPVELVANYECEETKPKRKRKEGWVLQSFIGVPLAVGMVVLVIKLCVEVGQFVWNLW